MTGYVSHGEYAGDNSVPSNKSRCMHYTVCNNRVQCNMAMSPNYTNDYYLMTTVGTTKVLNECLIINLVASFTYEHYYLQKSR